MLIPFNALQQLPVATVDNLIKEYLFTQLEDGSFAGLADDSLTVAITHCKQHLQQGLLVVEFSEEDDSIAIRSSQDLIKID